MLTSIQRISIIFIIGHYKSATACASARLFDIGSCPGRARVGTGLCLYAAGLRWPSYCTKPRLTRELAQLARTIWDISQSSHGSRTYTREGFFAIFGQECIHGYLMTVSASSIRVELSSAHSSRSPGILRSCYAVHGESLRAFNGDITHPSPYVMSRRRIPVILSTY